MKLIRNAFAVGLLATASLVACSSQHGTTGSTGGNGGGTGVVGQEGNLGSVGMHLQIGNGVVLQGLTWVISGTGLPTYNGTVPIGDAQSIEFVAGGIQAGGPYTITLTGSDNQGDPCTGSTTFTITAGMTTGAVVNITCTQPADASLFADVTTGNLAIDAGVTLVTAAAYHCPGITGISVNPAEVIAPQTSALDVTTTVTSGGTAGTATINWTATGGTFSDTGTSSSTIAAPTYNCPATPGTYQVTVTIGLTGSNNGVDAGDVCATAPFQTISEQIVCEQGGVLVCLGSTPNQCGTGMSAFCTNNASDPNNCGTCGTVCPSAESCQSGTCACPTAGQSLCGATCTNENTDVNNCGTCGTVCPTGDSCIAGACSAPAATLCTAAPCGASTITCPTETNGVCNGTEAAFVKRDIANGVTHVAGSANVTGSCFSCLLSNSCIDFPTHHVTGQDCEDLGTGTFTPGTGNGAAGPAATLCDNVLNCIAKAGETCGENAFGETFCYCGSQGGSPSACETAPTVNGDCTSVELNGFTYTTNASLITNFDDTTEPSGVANQIIACAQANSCTGCY